MRESAIGNIQKMTPGPRITDSTGAHISPSPLLADTVQHAPVVEMLVSVDLLRSRVGAARLWLAEQGGPNRVIVLNAIEAKAVQLPETPQMNLRFFDGRRMRKTLTQQEHRRLRRV